MNLAEDIRKTEELLAPGGWQVCCLMATTRDMQRKAHGGGDGPAASVEVVFQRPGLGSRPPPTSKRALGDRVLVCRLQ
eukprot:7904394-Lingulodinium_polyedra.AAC.1